MPTLLDEDDFSQTITPDRFGGNEATQQDMAAASGAINRQNHGVFATLAGDAGLGVVDLADTVASSIPVLSRSFGIERGATNSAFLRAIDSPGLTDFYNDNKGGIEAASGIYGIIASELVARKLTAPAGLAMRALKGVGWGRRIASLDMQYERAMKAVRLADTSLAARGALGAEQFVGKVILPSEGLAGLAWGSKAGATVGRDALYRSAKMLGIAKGVRNAAVTEAVMATTLNQNGFLYDDDMAHNMMWMAGGLGLAGAFESVATGYAIRKAVNKDEIRRTFANALDVGGEEEARTGWFGKKVDTDKFTGLGDIPKGQGALVGTITDNVTNLLVGAKSKTGTAVDDAGLFSNRGRLATQETQLAMEEVQKATIKGIEGNGRTRVGRETKNAEGIWNHLQQAMNDDPGVLYGVEEIGASLPDESAFVTHMGRENRIKAIIDSAQAQIDEAIEAGDMNVNIDQLGDMIRRYKWKQQFTPVPLIDGERATLSDLRGLDGWVEPTITKSALADNVPLWEAKAEASGRTVGLDANGQMYLPNNVDLNKADHFDVMRLYRLGQQMIDHHVSGAAPLILPKDANWFQLDLAEEILKANPSAKVQWPEGMNRASAQVESFAQKADALRQEGRKAKIREVAERRKGNEYDPAVEASKMRVRFNLPRLTAYERGILPDADSPVEQLLRGAAEMGGKEIRKLTLEDLKKAASDFKRIGDFAPTATSDFKSLTGNSFRYMMDRNGNPTRPILMYSRPMREVEWAPDYLTERMAAGRLNTMTALADGPTQTANLTKLLVSSPDLDAAARTRELMETQVQGSLVGTNHLGAVGAFNKATRARDWIGRDNPTLLAASRLQERVQRFGADWFSSEAKGLHTVASQLDSPRNTASKLLLNNFVAHRPGWDLLKKKGAIQTTVATLPDGKTKVTQFVLAETEQNQRRWQEVFGEAMPEDAVLTAPNGKAVGLDDMGMAFMDEFNRMTASIRENKNHLLSSQGLKQIDELPYYIPPKNINGKFIGFTQDTEGKVVPGMTVIADTESEFAAQQAKVMKEIEDRGLTGYRFRTQEEINQFANIWDRAQMDMLDPGTTAIQGGKRSKGALQALDVDMKGVDGILATLRAQYLNHPQDVLRLMFKDQVNSAEARSNIATALVRNNANPAANQKYRTIHDMYLENLLGRSPLKSKGSPIGGLYNWVEGKADQILGDVAPKAARMMTHVNSFVDRATFWRDTDGAKRDFDSLTRYLGDFMPFKDSVEYVERLSAGSMPPKLKDIMGGTSRFTAGVMLRFFEPVMALMNLSGMVNAMPAVIRHVQQQAGESAAEHAARVGHLATIFEDADKQGNRISVLNMGKLMQKGFQLAWQRTSHADYDYMVRNGFLTQEVAEFQKQFGSIETKSDWNRFFFGDENAAKTRAGAPKLGERGAVLNRLTTKKGIDGWMSILTDKSEDFSRSWGHMTGLALAEELGITGREAKHAFAHDIANKMIANYNPNNRPEIYQGALGAPLGLFQSFIMNYYQRMFRYLETKDLASAGIQSAMQSALFGVPTIPGFSAAANFFFEHTNGEEDPIAAIQGRFGASAGDLLYGGVLSNIPKLFGAEGVDLYSRGDVSIRLPGSSPVPAWAVAAKVLGSVSQGAKLFSTNNPDLSSTQVAEILSNVIPNRPVAGMVEQLFAHGNDTDAAGQLVSHSKGLSQSMEGWYRMIGVRSMRQAKDIEAFYKSRNQQSLQAAMKDQLRMNVRSAFRDGDEAAIPKILERYIENGGDPRNARRWLMENYKAATETRSERMLNDSLNSPDKMAYAIRLLDAGVSIDEDEETQPYSESIDVDASEFGQVNNEMMDYEGPSTQNMMDVP